MSIEYDCYLYSNNVNGLVHCVYACLPSRLEIWVYHVDR